MKAVESTDRSVGDGQVATMQPGQGLTWYGEEQPAFRQNLRVLPAPAAAAETELQLRTKPEFARPVSRIPAVVASLRASRTACAPTTKRGPARSSFLIPFIVLTAITILGGVATVQSVSAFRSSWQSTDTGAHQDTARERVAVSAESGETPAPFVPLDEAR